jgi:hypothetical protein
VSENQGLTGDRERAAILETHSPLHLLFPSCFTLLYKCNHDSSIATVQFPGQELQDSCHAAPVWYETMMSDDQRPKATATLPRVTVPPRSWHPVSWFEHHGIKEGRGDSELVKFIDDNTNRKPPPGTPNTFFPSLSLLKGLGSTSTWLATCS